MLPTIVKMQAQESHAISGPVRRRFVGIVCVVCFGAAVLWNLIGWLQEWNPFLVLAAFGGSLIPLLIVMRRVEQRLRTNHLPAHGRRLWCFQSGLVVSLFSVILVLLLMMYGARLPGVYRSYNGGRMGWYDRSHGGNDYSSPVRTAGYSEVLTPTWAGGLRSYPPYRPVALRFHPRGQPESSGWIIHPGEQTIRRERDGNTQPWTGAGLSEVLSDIAGRQVSAAKKADISAELDPLCLAWSGGHTFVSRRSLNEIEIGNTGRYDFPPFWLASVISAVVVAMIAAAVQMSAKATMGDG